MKDELAEKRFAQAIEQAYVAGWKRSKKSYNFQKDGIPEEITRTALSRARHAIRKIRMQVKERTLEGPTLGTRGTCPEHGCQDREPVWYMPTKTSKYSPHCGSYRAGTNRVCFHKLTDVHQKGQA